MNEQDRVVVPDSSLREQLEAAFEDGTLDMFDSVDGAVAVARIWPILEAWEAAARADEREKIAKAIDAEANRKPHGFREHAAIHSFWDSRDWLRYASRLARSAGVEPKEQQT